MPITVDSELTLTGSGRLQIITPGCAKNLVLFAKGKDDPIGSWHSAVRSQIARLRLGALGLSEEDTPQRVRMLELPSLSQAPSQPYPPIFGLIYSCSAALVIVARYP